MSAFKAWRDQLAEGRFMLQRTPEGEAIFYPRVMEPRTGGLDLDWFEASGRGLVYATTVVRRKDPTENYNVALIALEEGPRMMSRVEGLSPDAVEVGLAVQAEIAETEEGPVVVFRPR